MPADTARRLKPGDYVLLNSKHIALRKRMPKTARKLMPRFVGPFRVVQRIGEVAYRLDLPASLSRLHPVFHVSLLKLFRHNADEQQPAPIVWAEDPEPDNPLFAIDAILSHRVRRRRGARTFEFLVKWTGLGPEHNEWVAEHACTPFAIQDYWRRLRPEERPASCALPDAPAETARR